MCFKPAQLVIPLLLCISCTKAEVPPGNEFNQNAESNKSVVRYLFESVWNEARLDDVNSIWDSNVVFHFRGRSNEVSPEALQAMVQKWRQAFPDFRFYVEDVIAEGDRVAARVRFTGTHTGGEWFNLPPTGKTFEVTEMMFFRLQGGKVVEAWEDYDEYGMRMQLGANN